MTDQGFLVLKGRTCYGSDGILVNDILFETASAASYFVCGGSSNRLVDWKNSAGVPLKKLMDDGPEKCRAGLFHLSGRGIEATGYEAADGSFVVCKGSGVSMTEEETSCRTHCRRKGQERCLHRRCVVYKQVRCSWMCAGSIGEWRKGMEVNMEEASAGVDAFLTVFCIEGETLTS